jgi:diadenosine tetraphosphate (Ap4A) HIT family hydrolase
MQDCALCGAMNGELARTEHWRIVLNENQDRLGKSFFVLDRHEEDVCKLAQAETDDLWSGMRMVKSALAACFQPDHFNYMFLMNQDAHVHLHVIPRYRSAQMLGGITFPVLNSLDGGNFRPAAPLFEQIASLLRDQLATASAAQQ